MPSVVVLGAYGSKGVSKNTTCIEISKDSVIDAGNIIGGMGDNAKYIDNIFVTHCHFDNLLDIPFLLDMYFAKRSKPYKIYALPQTIDAIKKHLLNDYIWPDFSKIKMLNSEQYAIEYIPVQVGVEYAFTDFSIKPIELNHSVECCGFLLKKQESSILIGADTYLCDSMSNEVNSNENISSVIIECSFPSAMPKLAEVSRHLTPKLASEMVDKFDRDVKVYINHLKPVYEETILKELGSFSNLSTATVLRDMTVIDF